MPENRKYEETHPWITFQFDLRRAPPAVWLLMGEAKSKCEHISGIPLMPAVALYLQQLFLAKGVLATTAIEGNTLTADEVLKHLDGKLQLPPSKEYLRREIDNILRACTQIGDQILPQRRSPLSVEKVKEYNRQVLEGLPIEEGVLPGEIRTHSVGVGRYRGAPAEDCEYLLRRLCDWLEQGFEPPEGNKLAFGILKAVITHLYLVWIHPFADGNGRTARLMEFGLLLAAGVPAPAAHLLSDHYNRTRIEYYRHLDYAHQSGGDVVPFVEYAIGGFVEGLREQIQVIREQQLTVHLVNYVHDRFRNRDTKTSIRRRNLAIDLTSAQAPVPMAAVRHVTPRMAEAYASKTDKTVKRDVNALEKMELVVRTAEGVRAKREVMLAFLPAIRKVES